MRAFNCAFALACLISAPPARAEAPFDYKGLGDTAWQAKEWNGAAPAPLLVPEIAFAPPNRFTAAAGCNRYMGVYTVSGDRIAFAPQGSTKMACHGERGTTDARLVADLKRIAQLTLSGDGTLTAHAADGAAILRLRCTKNC